ncbi:response regulator transcription factor [Paenibacillus eucommiae]|uniref:DNA-binding NarL/FixJ family response regulator n=1 Tax=Paenibacillus eucommiae TaxID=1355755 RepID=A0ABS4IXX3_9BACL|nr:response regulator transcription factor [Paenibacillus eucommiae]MBP1992400.1 DNA-binding NarL/FixJ family response regulator [Paenibacillus eucommiae]
MKPKIKTLIVEDHPLMASATKTMLEQIDRIEVIGTAGSGEMAIELVNKLQPGIVFLDYHLPDGFGTKVAAQIKEINAAIHVIIFTGIDISDIYNNLLEIGISGVVSKESSEDTIRNLVNCVMDNHTMLPLPLYHQMRLTSGKQATEVILTDDEVQIMTLIVKGVTHDLIADHIHASRRSVDNYVRKIYDKYGVKSRVQAIERFVKSKYYSE